MATEANEVKATATKAQLTGVPPAAAEAPKKAERKPAAPLEEKSAVVYLTSLLKRIPSKRTQIRVLRYLLDKATDELAEETQAAGGAPKA